jgi:site-specific DNA-methyltransferase (adenine-specific)
LGIKERPEKNGEAIKFLKEKTRGQRVFIKFSTVKHDEGNNLLCYLYLENKTFLNAHLIKNNLVLVDQSYDYSYKERFKNYEKNKSN